MAELHRESVMWDCLICAAPYEQQVVNADGENPVEVWIPTCEHPLHKHLARSRTGPKGDAVNAYGTPISIMRCGTCGDTFTVVPAVDPATWGMHCLAPTCPSYDPARDAEIYFAPDDPGLIESEQA